jgi:putative ABC transport system permease protein
MGLALKLARRSLGAHPGRALFSILGVAMGIATGVAVFTLDHVTVLSRTARLDPGSGADLEVRPRTDLDDPRAQLLALEGVAGVAAFFQNDVRVREPSSTAPPARVRLFALEEGTGPTLGVYHVERGGEPTSANGLLIGRALATELGIEPGAELVLSPPERAGRGRCIEGVMQEAGPAVRELPEGRFLVAGILAPEGVGRMSKGRVVVMGYGAGLELFADVRVESQFWLKRDGATDLEALEARLTKGFTFDRNQAAAVGQMADERAFRNGVRVAGLFALLLGLFVIFHTLSMSLVERVREVGTLFSLSASRGQIARAFFCEALVIAALAGALGLAGGLGLARVLLRMGVTTLGMSGLPIRLFVVPWTAVGWLTGLGVGIALLGSVYPILRVRGTDVVAALRGDEPGKRGGRHSFHLFSTFLLVVVVPLVFFRAVPVVGAADPLLVATMVGGLIVLGLLIGIPLLAPGLVARASAALARTIGRSSALVARLAGRNLEQSPGRIGASISAVALVTAAFVALKGMTASLAAETVEWGKVALGDKLLVEYLPDADFDALREALHQQAGVLGVESGDARAFPGFLVLGQVPGELAGYGPLAEDTDLLRRFTAGTGDEQGIVISKRLARQRGLGVGDQVLMQTSGHGVQAFTVLTVTDEYGYFFHPDERAYGVIDATLLKRYFCTDVVHTDAASVRLGPGVASETISAAVRRLFPDAKLSFYDGPRLLEIMRADLVIDFLVFDLILLLTAILAALGVLNGQLLSALERQKELGVLQALGTTRGQMAGMLLCESATVGVIGGGLGTLVGLGLTPVLVAVLSVLSGLELPVRTAGGWIAFALAGALLLTVLAGIVPVWRANRIDAVRAVRTG